MFVLCPHCEFLVGVDPRTGQPPAACPKCGQALESAQADEAPVVVEETRDAAPDVVVPVEPVVESTPEPAKPQLDPDAIIAAISAKPRKSRAKPRTETKPIPSEKVPTPPRRKRAERSTAAPIDAAPETTTTPAVPARPATPSLATRVAAWWSSRKTAQASAPPEPAPAQSPIETKRKASVRPIPSLRDRAAARAAAKHAQQVPEIEALSIGDAEPVVVETPVVEPPAVQTAPVEEAPVETAAVETTPVETAPVETPPSEATTTEEKPVESAPAEAGDVAAPDVATTEVTEPAPLPPPEPRLAPRPASAPSFLRARTGPATRSTHWQQFATLGALSLLLVLQLLLAQRDALAADARWRPAIGALCTVARCARLSRLPTIISMAAPATPLPTLADP